MRWLQPVLVCVILCAVGCTFLAVDVPIPQSPRDAMRALVVDIAATARREHPQFLVVPQNGEELLTVGTSAAAPLATAYVAAIDGLGREDLFYGYRADNVLTPSDATDWMLSYLELAEVQGIEVLTIDYCWDPKLMDASFANNAVHEFVSFAAPHRELDIIPEYPAPLWNESSSDILSPADVGNFLYLINPEPFSTKTAFIEALAETNYDALILDLEYDGRALSAADVASLKNKANGGRRIVLCYLSIGEAEDYRAYWDSAWSANAPEWLLEENPDWAGNYPVQFWHPAWREIVFAMMDFVIAAGCDGVYLDRVDVYEEFEN